MNKTVLLTGANGFVGRFTQEALKRSGYEVICCVRGNLSSASDCWTLKCDLDYPDQIISLKNRCRADVIVHLGCRVGLGGDSDEQLFTPNVLATGCIAYLARTWNAKLIFSSTAIVHGAFAREIGATSPVKPDTPYGKSKALGEEIILASGVESTILRIAGIYGYNGPRHLRINGAIIDAMDGKRPTRGGFGKARRNYIYVRDVADAVVAVLENDIRGIHFAAGREILSIDRMLEMICEEFLPGNVPEMVEAPEAMDQIISNSLELPPTRTFQQALRDIRRLQNSCG